MAARTIIGPGHILCAGTTVSNDISDAESSTTTFQSASVSQYLQMRNAVVVAHNHVVVRQRMLLFDISAAVTADVPPDPTTATAQRQEYDDSVSAYRRAQRTMRDMFGGVGRVLPVYGDHILIQPEMMPH